MSATYNVHCYGKISNKGDFKKKVFLLAHNLRVQSNLVGQDLAARVWGSWSYCNNIQERERSVLAHSSLLPHVAGASGMEGCITGCVISPHLTLSRNPLTDGPRGFSPRWLNQLKSCQVDNISHHNYRPYYSPTGKDLAASASWMLESWVKFYLEFFSDYWKMSSSTKKRTFDLKYTFNWKWSWIHLIYIG